MSHVAFPGSTTITSPGTSRCDNNALQATVHEWQPEKARGSALLASGAV